MAQQRRATAVRPSRAEYEGDAMACGPKGQRIRRVHAHLLGGSGRYSVGGQPSFAARWWRGELSGLSTEPELPCGSEVWIELDDGRAGLAVVEPAPAAEAGTVVVRGIGPPPFDVP